MLVRPLFNFWLMIAILIVVAFSFLLLPLFKTPYKKVNRLVYFVYLPIFAISALGLYGYWGAYDKINDSICVEKINLSLNKLSQKTDLTPDDVAVEFDGLAKEVSQSAPALARLGALSLELGWYQKSIDFYAKAKQLAPEQNDYWLQWIYSHSLLNQGKLPLDVKQIACEKVAADPKQYAMMNLLAINDYFVGEYAQAIAGWEALLNQDRELTPERRQVLLNAIAKAKSHLPQDEKITFKIHVSLANELTNKIAPLDPVFVLVRLSGERRPIWVIKKSAQELPFDVNLDDQHAMTGGASLSPNREVEVVAKVSKSGNPLEKKGDLRGISAKIMVKSGENSANVVIDKTV